MIPTDWVDVSSSSISKVKFIQNSMDDRGDLLVEFTSGKVYQYSDIPARLAEGLIHASSPGGYFKAFIGGSYDAQRQ